MAATRPIATDGKGRRERVVGPSWPLSDTRQKERKKGSGKDNGGRLRRSGTREMVGDRKSETSGTLETHDVELRI